MAPLLDAASELRCAHGGRALAIESGGRVRLSGQPVALSSWRYEITACGLPPAAGPCISAMVVAGQSQRVRASGVPVLHGGLVAVCEPNGTKLTVVQTQRRVSAD